MSGKINQFEEIAEEYTFILNLIDWPNKMILFVFYIRINIWINLYKHHYY
jgi:hypothetical protein